MSLVITVKRFFGCSQEEALRLLSDWEIHVYLQQALQAGRLSFRTAW